MMAAPTDLALAAQPVAEVAMLDAGQAIPEPPAESDLGSNIILPDKDFTMSGNVTTFGGEQGFAFGF